MKLKNVTVKSCERKNAREGTDPGVVVAQCRSAEDKEQIMKAKPILRQARAQYKDIRISHDYPVEQRVMRSNLRLIQQCLGDKDIELRGMKLIKKRKQGTDEGQQDEKKKKEPKAGSSQDNSPASQGRRSRNRDRRSSSRSVSPNETWQTKGKGKGKKGAQKGHGGR